MKERPILFSGAMVRALLDGSKTQTRRILKQASGPSLSVDCDDRGLAELSWLHGDGPGHEVHERIQRVPCPYGEPGDRLWVRESFWGCDAPGYGDQPCVVYDDEWHGKEYRAAEIRPWARKFGRIPSIHMPRDCSRITLEITGVRVERLQDISEQDALAEGVESPDAERDEHDWSICPQCGGTRLYDAIGPNLGVMPDTDCRKCDTHAKRYRNSWDSLNAARGYGWDTNPWVWIVEFKRVAE
ncbi:ASCH domain-containing protein [Paraburkholderia rhynchosiae]|uniref:Morphogenetic protein n=1 Tax=Paraburkholderia rhynchosiae TaxID=487049 RepID=A0A2N7W967_9BURK|nr:ASCH domain-containing protein [Paraburkholderia rhynchosiae]PMS25947.1 hypothetical protein C0Z16_27820 [Paraburkholderia rhynchosiae]CAB3730338.1 hypothetical protein LMG27174_05735 [Paraburkholderia rhynchosiae]